MVDTNSDPRVIDYVIPSNDDASKSIESIMSRVSEAIIEGLSERKSGKDEDENEPAEHTERAPRRKREEKVAAVATVATDDKEAVSETEKPKSEAKAKKAAKEDSTEEE